ncbi:hypothetical protein [Nitrosovibrio tenuis]|uniref:Uncharacterized protein n=1 Tax=Nitrosovibrio tenuis TaxID=1233 RepID=A0A1H7IIY6_9PROT|nr:hypothetical protein [Nitrosovibrio tenuis]SEK62446.1 hypothetical protein SAMN05216387_102191 [Nitrosovibrio tenuis]
MSDRNRKGNSGNVIPPQKEHPKELQKESQEEIQGETGIRTPRVDLPNPNPQAPHQTEEQPLLPHERDQTTRPTGTSLGTSNKQSQDVIEQAREDTEHGLKDTDRRGIPSDIIASDASSNNGKSASKRDDKNGDKKKK